MDNIKVKIIKDSISPDENRVTTFELEYPRYIHAQLLTHRVFSRNSASSRAIPIEKTLNLIYENPVNPIWTYNQPGMQGEIVVDPVLKCKMDLIWGKARKEMMENVRELVKLGAHKQDVNRLLEPFETIKTILTGSQFKHFFNLRISTEVQPETRILAEKMKAAYDSSRPELLKYGEWHTPYVSNTDKNAKDISVACCAQVSYRKLNTDPEKCKEIFYKLINGGKIHASPFEHVCRPTNYMEGETDTGNIKGFHQYRYDVEMNNGIDSKI